MEVVVKVVVEVEVVASQIFLVHESEGVEGEEEYILHKLVFVGALLI